MFRTFFSDNGILNYDYLTPTILTTYFSPVSLMLAGEPGTGKTTMVEILAHCEGHKFEIIDCPTLTQVEALLGIPNPQTFEKGSPDFEWAGGLAAKRPGVVLVDELTAAPQTVQTVLHEFIRTQRIGNHQLDCRVVATCNPPTMQTETNYMGTALATRLATTMVPLMRDLDSMHRVVDSFNIERIYSTESKCFIQDLAQIKPSPDAAIQATRVMHGILGFEVITKYSINYRQIHNLMHLLAQAYAFESANKHQFTNVDIGYLAASIIPCKLVKIPLLQRADMEEIAQGIAKGLPTYPFKEEITDNRKHFAGESYQEQFQAIEDESFETSLQNLDLEEDEHLNLVRISQLAFKLLDLHPDKLRAIEWSDQWDKDLIALLNGLKKAHQ